MNINIASAVTLGTHTKEECQLFHKHFTQKNTLSDHLWTHTKGKPYQYEHCREVSNRLTGWAIVHLVNYFADQVHWSCPLPKIAHSVLSCLQKKNRHCDGYEQIVHFRLILDFILCKILEFPAKNDTRAPSRIGNTSLLSRN